LYQRYKWNERRQVELDPVLSSKTRGNPLERLNKEVKWRTDVVGIFPNEASITRLIDADPAKLPPMAA